METIYLIVGLVLGILLGGLIAYFLNKSSSVKRSLFEDLNEKFIQIRTEQQNANKQLEQLQGQLEQEQEKRNELEATLELARETQAGIHAKFESQTLRYEEEKERTKDLLDQLETFRTEKQSLFGEKTQLFEENKQLHSKIESHVQEVEKLHQQSKEQFENLANKIFEEKSTKFSQATQSNLKLILEPFQDKIQELKNKVSESYEKESKERFSLGEKVKELAELNQQISQDAKNLTRALKGESKTQGNWGEMILESILEKSGLVKGREYFMEHQLTDQDQKALFSEFSGKKMRPDAVVKYPDDRSVIIDSKVSLTAYSALIDETDPDTYESHLKLHVGSMKNHILQLSQKAYDDYGKSLDFVMMFVPNEAAYIAAMQHDSTLWNYAYDRRILLLSPNNLITSLKLIADLWKREYQNRNAIEIAERGTKLYDKFVLFVENLEKVGKNIDAAQNSYNDAYKQLNTGRDNLISQTQKMKALGIKSKKEFSQSLIEQSEIGNDSTLENHMNENWKCSKWKN